MELRPYQAEDVAELVKHSAHGVFNEQRTGKTPTSIVAMDLKTEGRVIVVCPASMMYIWNMQIKQWTTRPSFVSEGTPKQRNKTIEEWKNSPNGFIITSYDTFKETKSTKGDIYNIIKGKPEGIIVDEVHRMTGRKTKNFNAINNTRHITHRLYLSGTPATSHPSQIWAILHMIAPKEFTSYWRFVEEFFAIGEQRLPAHVAYKTGVSSVQQPLGFLPGKEQEYTALLARYSIMRKRKDIMDWLQDVPITRLPIPPTADQEKHLLSFGKYFKSEHIYTQGVLDQIIRMRQVTQDPRLLGLPGVGAKTRWLKSYVSDYPEKSILIFTRFTEYAELLKKELGVEVELITGKVKAADRFKSINAFQEGRLKILIIQIDAGKEGITLDRADVSIFTDIYPPITDIQQARDRLVATTHERNTEKEIIELMLQDPMDEYIYQQFDRGAELVDITNNYINYLKEG